MATKQTVMKSYSLVVCGCLLLVLTACYLERRLEDELIDSHRDAARAQLTGRLTRVATNLEALIASNLALVLGAAAYVKINPDLDSSQFYFYAETLFRQPSLLKNIAAAPDMVIRMIYPLEGNREALGLDFREKADQRLMAEEMRVNNRIMVAGPLKLVQGGEAIIGRIAVRREGGKFWGLVSAPIDVALLYRKAGLAELNTSVNIAIRGRDAMGEKGDVFFGKAAYFDDPRAQLLSIKVGDGSWQLAAVPEADSGSLARQLWLLRSLFVLLLGAFLLAISFLFYRSKFSFCSRLG